MWLLHFVFRLNIFFLSGEPPLPLIVKFSSGIYVSAYVNTKIYVLTGYDVNFTQLGPVVQSVVSLTSSLRVISLTVLADSIHNILIFFAEKMWVAFALQKLLTFFQQKISAYLRITHCKF